MVELNTIILIAIVAPRVCRGLSHFPLIHTTPRGTLPLSAGLLFYADSFTGVCVCVLASSPGPYLHSLFSLRATLKSLEYMHGAKG